jgi:hypothetical protein
MVEVSTASSTQGEPCQSRPFRSRTAICSTPPRRSLPRMDPTANRRSPRWPSSLTPPTGTSKSPSTTPGRRPRTCAGIRTRRVHSRSGQPLPDVGDPRPGGTGPRPRLRIRGHSRREVRTGLPPARPAGRHPLGGDTASQTRRRHPDRLTAPDASAVDARAGRINIGAAFQTSGAPTLFRGQAAVAAAVRLVRDEAKIRSRTGTTLPPLKDRATARVVASMVCHVDRAAARSFRSVVGPPTFLESTAISPLARVTTSPTGASTPAGSP